MKILLIAGVIWLTISTTRCQNFDYDPYDEEDTEYKGKFIGEFNSYHHQVSGKAFAVDAYTILIKNFNYDGGGSDTFFWAGTSIRPGRKGFIVPDEDQRTNVLSRYLNQEIRIVLPDHKKITDIRWFSVFDLTVLDVFGDIYIPEDFEPPGPRQLSDIQGRSNGVDAKQVLVMDSKTLKFESFSYDGRGGDDVVFWVGVGPQPSSKGHQVPDDMGYLTALRRYDEEDIYLTLPGDLTIFQIRWFSVFDRKNKHDLGHLIIADNLNVPPALVTVLPHDDSLTNCEMLHNNFIISWSVFAPSITIQLSGLIGDNEYMAFGVSGKDGVSQMVGSDVAVAYDDGYLGYVDDYNITSKSMCSGVLGVKRGVCRDDEVGGIAVNNQIQDRRRIDGVTTITYRRTVKPTSDPGDLEIHLDRPTSIIWAIGRLAKNGRKFEPSFHHTYPKHHVEIDFGRKDPQNNCIPFTRPRMDMGIGRERHQKSKTWGPFPIFDPSRRTFDARLGPSGGRNGYTGMTNLPSVGHAWYINGYLAPELFLRRGLTYIFRVEGGNDPYSPEFYHPMVISTEPVGGFERMSERQRHDVRLLAGVDFTRRGHVQPTAAGRLCLWRHREGADRRLDNHFNRFERFRNSLKLECKKGEAAILEVTPNVTWPDLVYYQSYTQPYMGWKIHIVDNFNRPHYKLGNGAESRKASQFVFFAIFALSAFVM